MDSTEWAQFSEYKSRAEAAETKLQAAEGALVSLCNRVVDRHGAPDGNGGHNIRSSITGNCAYCGENPGHSENCILGLVENCCAILAGHAPASEKPKHERVWVGTGHLESTGYIDPPATGKGEGDE